MPNRYCQNFKKRIEELKTKAESLEGLLSEYRKTGKKEIAEEIEKELEKNLKEIEKFKEEFTLKVKELLEKWYPKRERLNEFLQDIKINEKGRVEIEKLDVSYCGLSSLYLPSLFEKIKVLDCRNNQLKSLPEKLPASLKVLDCHFNQLKSLPEKLPDSLEKLDCYYNQLESLPEKLPASLKVLYCDSNSLESLPTLPASLKVLDCSFNQLESLPELPDSLEVLWCNENPLTKETIEKIKSHPNYNPKSWTF
jgi:Leucine-rich repeat (LRR) protein